MKIPTWFILSIVAVALIQMGVGGAKDMIKRKSIIPSTKHAFADGTFLILLAIFLLMWNRL